MYKNIDCFACARNDEIRLYLAMTLFVIARSFSNEAIYIKLATELAVVVT